MRKQTKGNKSSQATGSLVGKGQKVNPHFINVTVSGFKSIERETPMDLRPLTVLAGANSAGKSSLIQPLLLMKQTLEDKGDPGALLILGENVKFTAVDQMMCKCRRTEVEKDIIFSFVRSDDAVVKQFYRRSHKGGLELYKSEVHLQEEDFKLDIGMSSLQVEREMPDWFKRFFLTATVESVAKKSSVRNKTSWKVKRSGAFLGFSLESQDDVAEMVFPFNSNTFAPASALYQSFISTIHVPGVRASPERLYRKASPGPSFPGTFDQYTASIIFQWQEEKDDRLHTLFSWLSALSLTNYVKAVSVEDTSFELKVDRLPIRSGEDEGELYESEAGDLVSIADVGFGVSQVLPVLVSLLAASKGTVVYIEQPELHLHPRAQQALAEPLKWAAQKGVITIVETHSAILLKALRVMVVSGQLSSEDTMLHWFSRDDQGATVVDSQHFPSDGDLTLCEDFTELELNATRQFLRAASQRSSQSG